MSQLQVTGEAKIRDIQGPVVANSGVITALNGAANQYVRGDGTLASFPTSGGGGSSVSYYLNGSVNQGTFGGSTYYQMSKNAIVGTGTNFSASANGLIAQFITDANDPDVVSIPSGNWNVEFFMNVSASSGALASFYVEFYKYNGSTFTLLATNVATPEQLTNTTTVDAYYTSVAMPLSTMAVTDRLAIRIFVNVAGKTVTLYTEDNRLCQVVTTFSKGLASLNNLTDQSQYLATGISGTDFNIVSSGDTHTFNLPVASATNTGKLSNTDWSTFNAKQAALSFTAPLVNTSNTISIPAATSLVDGYLDNLDWVNFNTAYNNMIVSAAVTGTTTKTLTLTQQDAGTITASWTDDNTDAVTSVFGRTGAVVAASGDYTTTQVTEGTNLYFTNLRAQNAITLTTTGTSGAATYSGGTLNIPQYQGVLTNPVTGTGTNGQIAYFNGTSSITSNAAFAFTPTSQLLVNNSVTAASAIARGTNLTPTLTAAANNDVLVGLDIDPTFTNGAFTNVANVPIRLPNVRGGFMWLGSTGTGNSGTGFQAYQFTTNDTTNIGTMIVAQRNASGSGTALQVQQLGTGLAFNVSNLGSSLFNSSITASGAIARGVRVENTLVAAANNDVLVGLDIAPTFTNGAFTGVSNIGLRVQSNSLFTATTNGTLITINQIAGNAGTGISYSGNGVVTPLSLTTSSSSNSNSAFTLINGIVTYAHYGAAGMGKGFNFNVTSSNTNTTSLSTMWGGTITATSNASGTTAIGLELSANSSSGTAIALKTTTGSVQLNTSSGNTLIGTTTDAGYKLDVNGTARVSGQLTANSFVPTSSTIPTNGMYLSGTNTLGFATNGTLDMVISDVGSVGIGTASLPGQHNLRISRNISGSTIAYGILNEGITQSGVTNFSIMYTSTAQTAAAAFTLNNMVHYYAQQATLGAGSAITNQYGFWVDSSLTGATNNFGFVGNIPAGTNRWNLFMAGTANNYLAGSLNIGGTTLTGYTLRLQKTITGATTSFGIRQEGVVQSDVTSDVIGIRNDSNTQAAAFTLTNYWHFWARQGTIGAGSAITNQYGYVVDSNMTGGTNNYGFHGGIAAGTNRWNLYMAGTAANYLAGTLSIGTTTSTRTVDILGAAGVNTVLKLESGSSSTQTYLQLAYNGATNAQSGYIGYDTSSNLILYTANTERLRVNSVGLNIGGNASNNASARLQVDSTTQGFLPPRMTAAQRAAIATPATGLMVYQTDGVEGVYVYSGGSWKSLTMV